jgi:hypothetical protein
MPCPIVGIRISFFRFLALVAHSLSQALGGIVRIRSDCYRALEKSGASARVPGKAFRHLVRCRPPPTFRIEDSIACRTPHADCHLPITDSADLLAQPTALLALEFLTPAHRQRPSATCSPAGLN